MRCGKGLLVWGGVFLGWMMAYAVLGGDQAQAAGAGPTGLEPASNFVLSMVLLLAGTGAISAIAYRGLQFFLAGERQHTNEWILGFAVGGGLIAGCRVIGAGLVGFAAGAGPAPVASLVGILMGDALYSGVALLAGMRLWWGVRRG